MRTAVLTPVLLLLTIPALRAQQPTEQRYTVDQVFPNILLVEPVGLVQPGDGSNRLFVVEQPGVIKVFENRPDVGGYGIFLDLRNKVVNGGEAGLLGLAFDPDYERNGYFYVNYTAPDPFRTVISRFRVNPDNPFEADSTSERIILTFDQPDRVHNGGQLAFGSDGYLYIASGDGGFAGDPQNNAQNGGNLLGKILRIDVGNTNIEEAYAIPPDNPFVGTKDFRPEIFAYGFRNPWRFSFDPFTGRLWTGDVGQDTYEEVDVVRKGANYGWPRMEGLHCFRPAEACDTTGLVMPLAEYKHDNDGGYAVTGGYVYRGPTVTSLAGRYIFGDFASGRIWAVDYDGETAPTTSLILDTEIPISSFGVDAENELYIVSYGGALYKLVQPAGLERARSNDGFNLGASRPNPARDVAEISYTLDRPSHVTLTLHDMMGRELRHIADGSESAGEHRAKLDVAGLPAGAYTYRLSAEGRMATGRLMVAQ